MYGILFVCMGNICRSPLAEGVFRDRARAAGFSFGGPKGLLVDSAGTTNYHAGQAPDKRGQAAALARGYDISRQRARGITERDFHDFDRILVMDRDNLVALRPVAPESHHASVGLFMDYAPGFPLREVPDPYYGGPEGFEQVLDMIEQGVDGLLASLERELG